MEVCSLFSGGKDSTFALHVSILHGFRVKCLITVLPKRRDSWMFQSQNVDFTSYQADAMGLPLVKVESSGEKERELEDLREAFKIAKSMGTKGIVSGALLSDYQRININSVAHDVGLKTFSPLWRKDQERYLRELIKFGVKFIITSASAYGFPFHLVGKVIEEEDVELIVERARKYGFNPAFEGGEAETFVVEAPLFRRKLNVEGVVRKIGEFEWIFQIERIH